MLINSFKGYSISDPQYYERMEKFAEPGEFLELLRRRLGDRAAVVDGTGIWARCLDRPLAGLPAHGWKLHLSAQPDDLRTLVDGMIEEYLVAPFSFKVVRAAELGRAQLTRWWPRGGAGKAVTVYPLSETHAKELADRLSARFAGLRGPHVLTDRRYPGSDVVQYRYGTFRRTEGIDDEGQALNVVTGPDGQFWDDSRTPAFTMPDWIAGDPFAVEGDSGQKDPTDLFQRYRFTSVLRHSTPGGVYLATGPDGIEYVVKEARPYTAFAPDGTDAPTRLHREYDYLKQLQGTGLAPRAVELTTVWEHTYLVQTKAPGITLQVWLSRNHPHATGRPDPEYPARARSIVEQVRTALFALLDHGIVYSDTSLTNLIVDDDDTVRVIDFESCRPVGSDPGDYQRTPGFAPEPGTEAWNDDRTYLSYALATIEAATVMPRSPLLGFRPDVFGRALEVMAGQLEMPLGDLTERLALPPAVSGDGDLLPDVLRGLRAAATPNRDDRLFPGHPDQFRTNALAVAYGAAGVLRTLHLLAGPVDPELVTWLTDRLTGKQLLPMGLYAGRAGIASVLLEFGLDDRGLLDGVQAEAMDGDRSAGVATGLAGVGLALLHAYRLTGDTNRLDQAHEVANRLIDQADDDGTGLWWPQKSHPIGLMHGSSGAAVFLTELGTATDSRFLVKMGRRALAFDLAQARTRANGGEGFGASVGGWAYEPYVIKGGAGVGMAMAHHVSTTGDQSLVAPLRSVVRGVGMPFALNAGYFQGMTGIVEFLLDAKATLPEDSAEIDATITGLTEQIVSLRCVEAAGTGFVGDLLLRQSCDLASGSAGIALTLERVRSGGETLDLRYGRPAAPRIVADSGPVPVTTAAAVPEEVLSHAG